MFTFQTAFPDNSSIQASIDLIVMDVAPEQLLEVAQRLHDDPALSFRQMSDLCGVDYATYGITYCLSITTSDCVFVVRRQMKIFRWCLLSVRYTLTQTGTSAKPSTCSVYCSMVILIYVASLPTTVLPAIPSEKIFRLSVMLKCAMTR